jgi:hypothetical protein
MRSFVLQVVRACCKKKHMKLVFESDFIIFKNKRVHVVYIACYNILIVGIDMFQFNVKIIKDLVFIFILYLLLFSNIFKSENQVFFVLTFFS